MSISETSRKHAKVGEATIAEIVVPLRIESPIAVAADLQPITVGVPLPRGRVKEPFGVSLSGSACEGQPVQTKTLARWPDGSAKWMLVDFIAPALDPGKSEYQLTLVTGSAILPKRAVRVRKMKGFDQIETAGEPLGLENWRLFRAGRARSFPVMMFSTDALGSWDEDGPIRATFGGTSATRRARLSFFAVPGLVRLTLAVQNPQRASHSGGTWDIGDRNSIPNDAGVECYLNDKPTRDSNAEECWDRVFIKARFADDFHLVSDLSNRGSAMIEQFSSGGEHWSSRNHVDSTGRTSLAYCGYRLAIGDQVEHGRRAEPVARIANECGCLTVSIPEFWQNFPKTLLATSAKIDLSLFDVVRGYGSHIDDETETKVYYRAITDLQPGERKTHTVWAHLASDEANADNLAWTHRPARAFAPPEWYEECRVFPYFKHAGEDCNSQFDAYINEALAGENGLFAKREAADEYGWRNYGDVWADHEEAYYDGPKPIVSHYNNQFDMIYGGIVQMMRTGDPRWWDFVDPLARHVMDIDIYHTTRDKAAYNGGLFWFTDHYRDAATATHRTFSKHNISKDGSPYGGGPGAEHNFATGLLYYYYLTGNPDARDAVIGLAQWVINMDDGAQNILGLVDDGPTGLASMTGDPNYHGPGRGAANSINVLLDAWELTGEEKYLNKAEELITRVIHPADDVVLRDLLDVEKRWSYTMLLAALARYLDLMDEHGRGDRKVNYARESLLTYARWMADYERPYFEHPEQLEFPTEAWAAQEFRKANVLRMAAEYADAKEAVKMRARGDALADRAWADLMRFDSRYTTRAIAIMMIEGTNDAYFRSTPPQSRPRPTEPCGFGPPQEFRPQKVRVLEAARSPLGVASMLFSVLRPKAWLRLARIGARRWRVPKISLRESPKTKPMQSTNTKNSPLEKVR